MGLKNDNIEKIKECAKKMSDEHVGGMLVKDGSALLGFITEQDIVRTVVVEGKDVVDKIKKVETGNKSGHQNVPLDDVIIQKAEEI